MGRRSTVESDPAQMPSHPRPTRDAYAPSAACRAGYCLFQTSDSSGASSSWSSGLMERNVVRYRAAPNLATVSVPHVRDRGKPPATVVAHAQGFLRAHQALDGIEDLLAPECVESPRYADWMRFIFVLCRTSGRSSPPSAANSVFSGTTRGRSHSLPVPDLAIWRRSSPGHPTSHPSSG